MKAMVRGAWTDSAGRAKLWYHADIQVALLRMHSKADSLVWIDLEMTGLDPESDHIIEIATIVTDAELNGWPKDRPRDPPAGADSRGQDDWNRRTHGESGLVERVRRSMTTAGSAEEQTLAFLRQHVDPACRQCAATASARIGASSRARCRPLRSSSITETRCQHVEGTGASLGPGVLAGVQKSSKHLALDDIRESIDELRHYRQTMFRVN